MADDGVVRPADALRAVRAEWEAATAGGRAACGLPVAAAAFERMREAWSAELGAHAAILDRLDAAEATDGR